MKQEHWPVTLDAERPRRPDGTCFYCRVAVGQPDHAAGCVLRHKTVVVEFTVTLLRQVPEDWDADMIEFHANDSSWCADNLIDDMARVTDAGQCLCSQVVGKFVREASEEDETNLGPHNGDKDETIIVAEPS